MTSSNDTVAHLCLWCDQPFEVVRRHGNEKRFCSIAHRRAFDQAARAWVRHSIAAGTLTEAELRKVSEKPRALQGEPSTVRATSADSGEMKNVTSDAHKSGAVELELAARPEPSALDPDLIEAILDAMPTREGRERRRALLQAARSPSDRLHVLGVWHVRKACRQLGVDLAADFGEVHHAGL